MKTHTNIIRVTIILTLSVIFAVGLSLKVKAAPGDLDPTFGVNGRSITNVGNIQTQTVQIATGMALQTNGRIVVVGWVRGFEPTFFEQMVVIRYNTNGSLDTTFGSGGIVVDEDALPNSRNLIRATAVAIQADGKIVVVGRTEHLDINGTQVLRQSPFVVRYNSDGSHDTSFGSNGIVRVLPAERFDGLGSFTTNKAYSVALQADGKIVVAGSWFPSPTALYMARMLLRLNSDGSFDSTFGPFTTAICPFGDNLQSLMIQQDGKIVTAGNCHTERPPGTQTTDIMVMRYNQDGSPDTSFDGDGILFTPSGVLYNDNAPSSITQQTDGKIVLAGGPALVLRYNPNGSLDSSFDGDGIAAAPFGGILASVSIHGNDGKIVAVGQTSGGMRDLPNINGRGRVVRFKTNGSLDSIGLLKWGSGGVVEFEAGVNCDSGANAAAILPDGKVLVAGYYNFGCPVPLNRFLLNRYQGDPAQNFDYDRDGTSDIAVFRPSEGKWYVLGSSGNPAGIWGPYWGVPTDKVASADYDGDHKTDFAVWREGTFAYLYILNSSNGTVRIEQFGQTGDNISVIGDYDGDGMDDPAVYRNAAVGNQSYFYYRGSLNNPNGNVTYIPWGTNGDIPARGDYNGDGRLDPTVFRPFGGLWYTLNSADNTVTETQWGLSTDKLVPGDYNGDRKTDWAVFRDGIWYIRLNAPFTNPQYVPWGLSTDKLVPADYDGDGRTDVAVYRDGIWYIRQSTSGNRIVSFGLPTDIPTPSAYLP